LAKPLSLLSNSIFGFFSGVILVKPAKTKVRVDFLSGAYLYFGKNIIERSAV
jgi:hypothetical protein